MDPEKARAYLSRWQLVQEREIAELRRTSSDTKLKQLEALFASRDAFGADPDRAAEERTVRERWIRLRQALSA
jgi:hypothetical protein